MAACAGAQADPAFWSLHDFFFQAQDRLTAANIQNLGLEQARLTGVDRGKFDNCITNRLAGPILDRDMALARRLGVTSTPTVYLNGERIPPAALSGGMLLELVKHLLPDSPK